MNFPFEYSDKLIPYSWSISEHYGILNFWTRYCSPKADKDSIYFTRNYLKDYFLKKTKLKFLGKEIQDYISYINKCFTVCWNNEEYCFKISMKRDKNDNKQTVFDKETFYSLSEKMGISKTKAKVFLKQVLDDMIKFYDGVK